MLWQLSRLLHCDNTADYVVSTVGAFLIALSGFLQEL